MDLGETILHYKILEFIGQGGMGMVFKAQDIRLLRHVAIKILQPHFVSNGKKLSRFIQEARTASALNHPNICTIHDIGEQNNLHYIVMEFIEGETLRDILEQRGSISEAEVIDIGIQICNALAAAHEKGIIHRDIKPENLMLAKDGRVMVLDFGLAKLKNDEYDASNPGSFDVSKLNDHELLKTSASSLMGTASYMAPEIIRKKTTDERIDIFSLGVVLYELVAGTHPFAGRNKFAVMQSILSDIPQPLSALSPGISKETGQTILKALAKIPNERHETASAFSIALTKSPSVIGDKSKRYKMSGKWAVLGAAILITITLMLFSFQHWFRTSNGSHLNASKMYSIRLTSGASNPAFSPDGNRIIYNSYRFFEGKKSNIWIKNLITGRNESLFYYNKNEQLYVLDAPDWSPDGNMVAVSNNNPKHSGIFLLNISTGNLEQVTDFGWGPKWSPDGRQIVFTTNNPVKVGADNAIYLFDCNLNIVKKISPDNGLKFATPSWSPDARWVLCTAGEGSQGQLWLLDVETRDAHQISNWEYRVINPLWSPAGLYIYFLSGKRSFGDIWKVGVNTRIGELISEPEPITAGYRFLSMNISPQGNKIITTQITYWNSIDCSSLNDIFQNQFTKSKTLIKDLEFVENFDLSPDGSKIVVELTHNEKKCLRSVSLETGEWIDLCSDQLAFAPSWSADSKWIAFDAGGGNNADIWRIPAEGGMAEKIIDHPGADWMPTYSPQGDFICLLSNRSEQFDLWIENLENRQTFQITQTKTIESRGAWSHDGTRIAYYQESPSGDCMIAYLYHIKTRANEELVKLPIVPNSPPFQILGKLEWSHNDYSIYLMHNQNFYEIDINSKSVARQVPFFQGGRTVGMFEIFKNDIYFVSNAVNASNWIIEGI